MALYVAICLLAALWRYRRTQRTRASQGSSGESPWGWPRRTGSLSACRPAWWGPARFAPRRAVGRRPAARRGGGGTPRVRPRGPPPTVHRAGGHNGVARRLHRPGGVRGRPRRWRHARTGVDLRAVGPRHRHRHRRAEERPRGAPRVHPQRTRQALPLQGAGESTHTISADRAVLVFSHVCGSPPGKVRASPAVRRCRRSEKTRSMDPLRT